MSYIAERRQEEKDRRRAEIIDAAEDLYRELGWDAVTMDSVAKRARLSRALVYVYFKDKSDLRFAITGRALVMLRARFQEAASRAKLGLEKIESTGRAYMAFAQEFPHYFDACARMEAHGVEDKPSTEKVGAIDAGNDVHDTVVQALEAGQKDGTVRTDLGDLRVTSLVLWGFTHGLMQIAMTKDQALAQKGISVPQLTQQAIELTKYMLAGSKTPGQSD